MRRVKLKKNGFSLIELMVSVAIGSGALYVLGRAMNQLNAGSKKIDAISGINDLKSIVWGFTSCQTTFASRPGRPACSDPGTYIDVFGRPDAANPAGRPIIKAGGSKYGEWTVRALCTSSGLDIRASMILKDFESETNALTDWRNTSSPSTEDSKKYTKDYARDSANSRYSWDHPLTKISTPGLLGLCNEYFSTTANTVIGCNPGEYLKEINLIDGTFLCNNIPKCSSPEALKFGDNPLSGKKELFCSAELYNQITTDINNYKNSKIGPFDSYANDTINNLQAKSQLIYNTLFQVFNPANDFILSKNTRDECAQIETMKCPSGWIMTSYEFRYDTGSSQTCSLNCRKVAP
ncbi:MAG: prepilin-type N-terminal cleavage/methylation domain-containing protein [Pseudomonadota bacterium]